MTHVLERTDRFTGDRAHRLHGVDPRVRIVVMAAFAVVVVALDDIALLCLALGLAAGFAVVARLPVHKTVRRVAAMDAFIFFMLLMLPFTVPGEEMLRLGPLVATWEGLWQAIEIALKANAIVLALLALIGSMEAVTLGYALRRLHAPEKLINLLFFTVRYVEVMAEEYHSLRLAMKARAFRPRSNMHTWRSIGYLVGMLLVRSLERSERILAAMKCRGYTGIIPILDTLVVRPSDLAFAAGCFGVMAVLVALQYA